MRLDLAAPDFLSAIQYRKPIFRDSRLVTHPKTGAEYVTVSHSCDTTLKAVAVPLEKFQYETRYLLAYLARERYTTRKA